MEWEILLCLSAKCDYRYFEYVRDSDLPWNPTKIIGAVKNLNIPIIGLHQEFFTNHPDPLPLYPFRIATHLNAEAIALGVTGEQKSRKTTDESRQ